MSLSNLLLMSDADFLSSFTSLPCTSSFWSKQREDLVREIFTRLGSLNLARLSAVVTPPSNTGVNLNTPLTAAKIDYLTITFTQDYFGISVDKKDLSNEDVRVIEMTVRKRICPLLEVDISEVRKGYNNYQYSVNLLSKGSGKSLGFVAWGGVYQRGTWALTLKGDYCEYGRSGWETNLYAWIKREFVSQGRRAKITRVDLAHDDYTGKNYSVDKAHKDYLDGLFKLAHGGRSPRMERRNWDNPHEGRTFYVGTREGGKLLRVYEKGKQLGGQDSNWVRIEVELHSTHRQIPLEILLSCGDYLAGAYPALSWICEEQSRIKTFLKSAKTTLEKSLRNFITQCGTRLKLFRNIGVDLRTLERDASTPTGLSKNIQDLNIYAESPENLKNLLLSMFGTNKDAIGTEDDFIFEP
ncbi:replication initiation factor domain-containing protein [Neomegalonema sp.]|uniref:replication initiation factor domain-containing protein n=1 Tax=Neomegalonema sp. TaxID=2039713 RepID=UPI00261195C4|nr:replication initiation factor domain-containing protein [Neomegalonema sp.]MDD2870346.1 replication initiation factor domain-containing protein [Neomegalonema sp.]